MWDVLHLFQGKVKTFGSKKTIPIRAKDQIFGRVLSSLFVQLIGIAILIGTIAYIGVLNYRKAYFGLSILGVLGSITMTELGMIMDILQAYYLIGITHKKVMKQNLNVLIAMGSWYAFYY